MKLIKQFTKEEYTKALESWRWLVPDEAVPLMTSSFGDVFFAYKAAHQASIYFLDLVNGTFELIAQNAAELNLLLKTSRGQDDYLMAKLSIAKQKQGLSLDPDEILDFIQTPKLGGELSLDNLRKMKFVDSVNAAGQIHEQIKDLPAGTQITNVNVIDA